MSACCGRGDAMERFDKAALNARCSPATSEMKLEYPRRPVKTVKQIGCTQGKMKAEGPGYDGKEDSKMEKGGKKETFLCKLDMLITKQERERERCQEKHAVLTSSNKREAWGYFQPKSWNMSGIVFAYLESSSGCLPRKYRKHSLTHVHTHTKTTSGFSEEYYFGDGQRSWYGAKKMKFTHFSERRCLCCYFALVQSYSCSLNCRLCGLWYSFHLFKKEDAVVAFLPKLQKHPDAYPVSCQDKIHFFQKSLKVCLYSNSLAQLESKLESPNKRNHGSITIDNSLRQAKCLPSAVFGKTIVADDRSNFNLWHESTHEKGRPQIYPGKKMVTSGFEREFPLTKIANEGKKHMSSLPLISQIQGTKVCRMSTSQFLILLEKLVMHGVNRMDVLILNYFMIKLMTKAVYLHTEGLGSYLLSNTEFPSDKQKANLQRMVSDQNCTKVKLKETIRKRNELKPFDKIEYKISSL
eukprot:bmy_06622T0